MADLDKAIQDARKAVETSSEEEYLDKVLYLNHVGYLLRLRYLKTRAISDLEEAIWSTEEAFAIIPEEEPAPEDLYSNYGLQLGDRFQRTGAMADLENAIASTREAIGPDWGNWGSSPPAPDKNPNPYLTWAFRQNNLGSLLAARFARTGAMSDLDEAILVIRKAITITPEDHPLRAYWLNNLGIRLGDRFWKTEAVTDLEEAIRITREGIKIGTEDHSYQALWLNNLGTLLGRRFSKTGNMPDLEESIRVLQEALDITPEEDQRPASWLNNLGGRLGDMFSRSGATSDLKSALSYYQSALRQPNSPIISRIEAGREVLRYCVIASDWEQAYEASATAVPLVSKLTPRSLETSDRQYMLSLIVGLASDAAAMALYADKGPLIALELLEHGRGVLLDEMGMDISELLERYPELTEKFIVLRDELEIDKLTIEIRKRPGFERFLLAPSEEEIRGAARCGPIIIINISKYRCDAVLVEQHQIRFLALPYLNAKDIEEKAREGHLGDSKVLEWLWDVVANPILDAFGFTQPPLDGKWPHVWWIPTGPLSKFPLHAAGRHFEGSTETVLDRVMSSYSSSVKAIIRGRLHPLPSSSPRNKALVVAMKHTPGRTVLPFVAEEVEKVYNLCKSMSLEPIEPNRRAGEILNHFRLSKIFHFAGYGQTNNLNPLQSQLLVEDWKEGGITVTSILEKDSIQYTEGYINLLKYSPYQTSIDLRDLPFLAYLSACGTGQIKDEKFVDESIHLISAFQVGFRHVIGTLWEVSDELCVDMARTTYECMRDAGMTDESVCLGLHKATRELRERWVNAPENERQGSISVRKAGMPQAEDEKGTRSTLSEDQRDVRLPRDVVPCDDKEIGQWVPYIHFGV
ncbi:hypothetical protein G7Y89_g7384 [Cudoniella acicularis]|uniref:CHAT domain-containing protein n=1 Tax=Cudoniella acicularis TaxID=354080 RepID=A0A8H4RIN0_9HELO|nr:hypothetical protein G7Y89_g7384 [Cudoniella acicularis]